MRRAVLLALAIVLAAIAAYFMSRSGPPEADGAAPAEGVVTPPEYATAGATQGSTQAAPRAVEAIASSGVRLRLLRAPRIDPPSAPYAEALARLRPAAEQGDATAQYRLGLLLYRCRDVPATDAELAARIDRLYQTRRLDGWEVDDPAAEEAGLRREFRDCAGIDAADRPGFRDWMRRAAEAGLVDAQLNLMFHLPRGEYCQFVEQCSPQQLAQMQQLREEARTQVQRALEAGAVEALRVVGGWHLNEEMGPPDPVEAYALFSAYDQIQQAAGRERELGAMLAGVRARLRPVDLERAAARTRELLSNPDCCVFTR